jgi:hypothetical protein
MRKWNVLLAASVIALAAGCADHPAGSKGAHPSSAAQAARYGVSPHLLEEAANLGYQPQIRNGRTVFCMEEEKTGSLFSTEHCVDEKGLAFQLLQQRQVHNALQRGSELGGQ